MNNIKDIIEYPDFKNFLGLITNSYSGMKEVINPLNFFIPSKQKVDLYNENGFIKNIFSGNIVKLPYFNILDSHIEKFNRFEDYTKKDEVNNIATWILASFQYLSSDSVQVGKELEIKQKNNPRDGRLDVAVLKDSRTISIETKTDLKSLLNENRFISQIDGYKQECLKLNEEYLKSSKSLVLLAIGGEETDLFPPNHPECSTGKVGNISKLFYKKIVDNNIKFISANALWALVAYKFITREDIDLFEILFSVLDKEDTLGLLSAGVVTKTDTDIKISVIDM